MHKHFGTRLGCIVDDLFLLKGSISLQVMEQKVLGADIIYVGGGNTLKMMNVWRRTGLDVLLRRAGEKGIVLSGVSAGAICWFRYGSSDSRRFTNPEADLIRVSGLGFLPAVFCPHYDVETERKADVKKLMEKTPGVAIACDNCCAVEVVDDIYRVLTSKPTAHAYKIFWKHGKYYEQRIQKIDSFTAVSSLFEK